MKNHEQVENYIKVLLEILFCILCIFLAFKVWSYKGALIMSLISWIVFDIGLQIKKK